DPHPGTRSAADSSGVRCLPSRILRIAYVRRLQGVRIDVHRRLVRGCGKSHGARGTNENSRHARLLPEIGAAGAAVRARSILPRFRQVALTKIQMPERNSVASAVIRT